MYGSLLCPNVVLLYFSLFFFFFEGVRQSLGFITNNLIRSSIKQNNKKITESLVIYDIAEFSSCRDLDFKSPPPPLLICAKNIEQNLNSRA